MWGVVYLLLATLAISAKIQAQSPAAISKLGLTTAELIKQRGYRSVSYNIEVDQGSKLNLVRVLNPLIELPFRGPVIFFNAAFSSGTIYLVNSVGAEPRDFTELLSHEGRDLHSLLATDPSAKSLPLLLSNLGFDVWFVNKRSTPEAQMASGRDEFLVEEKSGASLLNLMLQPFLPLVNFLNGPIAQSIAGIFRVMPDTVLSSLVKLTASYMKPDSEVHVHDQYWNFTLDREADLDFPKAMDFVLTKANVTKVAVVAHSVGAAIFAMSLALHPELNDKVSIPILWSPTINGGHMASKEQAAQGALLQSLIQEYSQTLALYTGPVPPVSLNVDMTDFFTFQCQVSATRRSLCNPIFDLMFGIGTDLYNPDSGYFSIVKPYGSKEFLQIIQSFGFKQMHFFDYGSEEANMAHYGQPTPPPYDFGKITNKRMVIFQGNTDLIANIVDTRSFIDETKGPVELRYINTTQFNHLAYFFHNQNVDLVNIPCVKLLIQSSRMRRGPRISAVRENNQS